MRSNISFSSLETGLTGALGAVIVWAMALVGLQDWALKKPSGAQRAGLVALLFGILATTTLFVHFLFKEKYGFYPY